MEKHNFDVEPAVSVKPTPVCLWRGPLTSLGVGACALTSVAMIPRVSAKVGTRRTRHALAAGRRLPRKKNLDSTRESSGKCRSYDNYRDKITIGCREVVFFLLSGFCLGLPEWVWRLVGLSRWLIWICVCFGVLDNRVCKLMRSYAA